jgi:hypothetical protein
MAIAEVPRIARRRTQRRAIAKSLSENYCPILTWRRHSCLPRRDSFRRLASKGKQGSRRVSTRQPERPMPLSFPTAAHLPDLWGGRPRPRPAPWPAFCGWQALDSLRGWAGPGGPAQTRESAPRIPQYSKFGKTKWHWTERLRHTAKHGERNWLFTSMHQ